MESTARRPKAVMIPALCSGWVRHNSSTGSNSGLHRRDMQQVQGRETDTTEGGSFCLARKADSLGSLAWRRCPGDLINVCKCWVLGEKSRLSPMLLASAQWEEKRQQKETETQEMPFIFRKDPSYCAGGLTLEEVVFPQWIHRLAGQVPAAAHPALSGALGWMTSILSCWVILTLCRVNVYKHPSAQMLLQEGGLHQMEAASCSVQVPNLTGPGLRISCPMEEVVCLVTRRRYRNSHNAEDDRAAQKKVGLSKMGRGYL